MKQEHSYSPSLRSHKAFTLIELLVVIAIIAILAVVVVLTLNPAQLLAQSRDANRVSDLATMNTALNLYTVDQGGTAMGTSTVTYFSIPDMTAVSSAGTQCTGLGGSFPSSTYSHCAASSTYRSITNQGWIPVNFSSISSGAPFGSLPVDPVNSTSSNLYYTYQTNGNSFRLSAIPESQKDLAQAATNPTMFISGSNTNLNGGAWVLVPGNSTFGTNNFYVMKYDAGCSDGNGNVLNDTTGTDTGTYKVYMNSGTGGIACTGTSRQIASLPGAYPIADIKQSGDASHNDAVSYCANIGAHLITNNEWQTIAWNAENVASNWNGGVVGTNYMPRGNSNSSGALTASSDDTQVNYGETSSMDFQHQRTLTLSNGSVIWDMAGNVWQWTNDTIQDQNQPTAATTGFAWREFTAITTWGTMTQQTAGPSNTTWNSSKGMGQIYSDGTSGNATIYGFLRSGNWYSGGLDGVEALYLSYTPPYTNFSFGFRCAR
jgi:prepilin-type N-terminal cleavage/methylation domain-containing protein